VARTRTTKKLAQRVDLNYFKRPTAFKRARLWLSVVAPLLALAWIGWHGLVRDSRVYSSGRMSGAHAVLERQCAACHVKKAGEFSSMAADSACVGCHDGPVHRENQISAAVPGCATCHLEHRGRINLRAASNQSCAGCHGNLKVTSGKTRYAAHIHSLEDGHPEFAGLRMDGLNGGRDLRTIKLNHAVHMKLIRRGPNGPMVQLECGDCHRPFANQKVEMLYYARYSGPFMNWRYGDANYISPAPSYFQPEKTELEYVNLFGRKNVTGRELMAPVTFGKACAGCHSLAFDRRFREGVPHDQPDVVHEFVVKKFGDYISAHPEELRVQREPDREISGKPLQPEIRVFTPAQWVAERTAEAEYLLWRKTCVQCHTLGERSPRAIEEKHHIPYPPMTLDEIRHFVETVNRPDLFLEPVYAQIPYVGVAGVTLRWMPAAMFDHDRHRGFSCVNCHAKALTSTETSDVLVPGIANCKTCHAPGPEHAESGCFECHGYHDWSKRNEVQATFTLPGIQLSGR